MADDPSALASDCDPQCTYCDGPHFCPPPPKESPSTAWLSQPRIRLPRLESSRSSNAVQHNVKNMFFVCAKHRWLTLESAYGAEWEEAHAHDAKQEEPRIYFRVTGSFERLLDDNNGIIKEHAWSFESSFWRL